jgi:hypothetical protein
MARGLLSNVPDLPGPLVEGLSSIGCGGRERGFRRRGFRGRMAALVPCLEQEFIQLELHQQVIPQMRAWHAVGGERLLSTTPQRRQGLVGQRGAPGGQPSSALPLAALKTGRETVWETLESITVFRNPIVGNRKHLLYPWEASRLDSLCIERGFCLHLRQRCQAHDARDLTPGNLLSGIFLGLVPSWHAMEKQASCKPLR